MTNQLGNLYVTSQEQLKQLSEDPDYAAYTIVLVDDDNQMQVFASLSSQELEDFF